MLSMTSRLMTCCWFTFRRSTTGLAPATVIVSLTEPTASFPSISAVNPTVSLTPSRTTVLNPVSVKVTVYVPGVNPTIRY
jgi:hypothetical protein